MSTVTDQARINHASAEKLLALASGPPTVEDFREMLGVLRRSSETVASRRWAAWLEWPANWKEFLADCLCEEWQSLDALMGDKNSGSRCNQYETLVFEGRAERMVLSLTDATGRPCGSRLYFRQAREARP